MPDLDSDALLLASAVLRMKMLDLVPLQQSSQMLSRKMAVLVALLQASVLLLMLASNPNSLQLQWQAPVVAWDRMQWQDVLLLLPAWLLLLLPAVLQAPAGC